MNAHKSTTNALMAMAIVAVMLFAAFVPAVNSLCDTSAADTGGDVPTGGDKASEEITIQDLLEAVDLEELMKSAFAGTALEQYLGKIDYEALKEALMKQDISGSSIEEILSNVNWSGILDSGILADLTDINEILKDISLGDLVGYVNLGELINKYAPELGLTEEQLRTMLDGITLYDLINNFDIRAIVEAVDFSAIAGIDIVFDEYDNMTVSVEKIPFDAGETDVIYVKNLAVTVPTAQEAEVSIHALEADILANCVKNEEGKVVDSSYISVMVSETSEGEKETHVTNISLPQAFSYTQTVVDGVHTYTFEIENLEAECNEMVITLENLSITNDNEDHEVIASVETFDIKVSETRTWHLADAVNAVFSKEDVDPVIVDLGDFEIGAFVVSNTTLTVSKTDGVIKVALDATTVQYGGKEVAKEGISATIEFAEAAFIQLNAKTIDYVDELEEIEYHITGAQMDMGGKVTYMSAEEGTEPEKETEEYFVFRAATFNNGSESTYYKLTAGAYSDDTVTGCGVTYGCMTTEFVTETGSFKSLTGDSEPSGVMLYFYEDGEVELNIHDAPWLILNGDTKVSIQSGKTLTAYIGDRETSISFTNSMPDLDLDKIDKEDITKNYPLGAEATVDKIYIGTMVEKGVRTCSLEAVHYLYPASETGEVTCIGASLKHSDGTFTATIIGNGEYDFATFDDFTAIVTISPSSEEKKASCTITGSASAEYTIANFSLTATISGADSDSIVVTYTHKGEPAEKGAAAPEMDLIITISDKVVSAEFKAGGDFGYVAFDKFDAKTTLTCTPATEEKPLEVNLDTDVSGKISISMYGVDAEAAISVIDSAVESIDVKATYEDKDGCLTVATYGYRDGVSDHKLTYTAEIPEPGSETGEKKPLSISVEKVESETSDTLTVKATYDGHYGKANIDAVYDNLTGKFTEDSVFDADAEITIKSTDSVEKILKINAGKETEPALSFVLTTYAVDGDELEKMYEHTFRYDGKWYFELSVANYILVNGFELQYNISEKDLSITIESLFIPVNGHILSFEGKTTGEITVPAVVILLMDGDLDARIFSVKDLDIKSEKLTGTWTNLNISTKTYEDGVIELEIGVGSYESEETEESLEGFRMVIDTDGCFEMDIEDYTNHSSEIYSVYQDVCIGGDSIYFEDEKTGDTLFVKADDEGNAHLYSDVACQETDMVGTYHNLPIKDIDMSEVTGEQDSYIIIHTEYGITIDAVEVTVGEETEQHIYIGNNDYRIVKNGESSFKLVDKDGKDADIKKCCGAPVTRIITDYEDKVVLILDCGYSAEIQKLCIKDDAENGLRATGNICYRSASVEREDIISSQEFSFAGTEGEEGNLVLATYDYVRYGGNDSDLYDEYCSVEFDGQKIVIGPVKDRYEYYTDNSSLWTADYISKLVIDLDPENLGVCLYKYSSTYNDSCEYNADDAIVLGHTDSPALSVKYVDGKLDIAVDIYRMFEELANYDNQYSEKLTYVGDGIYSFEYPSDGEGAGTTYYIHLDADGKADTEDNGRIQIYSDTELTKTTLTDEDGNRMLFFSTGLLINERFSASPRILFYSGTTGYSLIDIEKAELSFSYTPATEEAASEKTFDIDVDRILFTTPTDEEGALYTMYLIDGFNAVYGCEGFTAAIDGIGCVNMNDIGAGVDVFEITGVSFETDEEGVAFDVKQAVYDNLALSGLKITHEFTETEVLSTVSVENFGNIITGFGIAGYEMKDNEDGTVTRTVKSLMIKCGDYEDQKYSYAEISGENIVIETDAADDSTLTADKLDAVMYLRLGLIKIEAEYHGAAEAEGMSGYGYTNTVTASYKDSGTTDSEQASDLYIFRYSQSCMDATAVPETSMTVVVMNEFVSLNVDFTSGPNVDESGDLVNTEIVSTLDVDLDDLSVSVKSVDNGEDIVSDIKAGLGKTYFEVIGLTVEETEVSVGSNSVSTYDLAATRIYLGYGDTADERLYHHAFVSGLKYQRIGASVFGVEAVDEQIDIGGFEISYGNPETDEEYVHIVGEIVKDKDDEYFEINADINTEILAGSESIYVKELTMNSKARQNSAEITMAWESLGTKAQFEGYSADIGIDKADIQMTLPLNKVSALLFDIAKCEFTLGAVIDLGEGDGDEIYIGDKVSSKSTDDNGFEFTNEVCIQFGKDLVSDVEIDAEVLVSVKLGITELIDIDATLISLTVHTKDCTVETVNPEISTSCVEGIHSLTISADAVYGYSGTKDKDSEPIYGVVEPTLVLTYNQNGIGFLSAKYSNKEFFVDDEDSGRAKQSADELSLTVSLSNTLGVSCAVSNLSIANTVVDEGVKKVFTYETTATATATASVRNENQIEVVGYGMLGNTTYSYEKDGVLQNQIKVDVGNGKTVIGSYTGKVDEEEFELEMTAASINATGSTIAAYDASKDHNEVMKDYVLTLAVSEDGRYGENTMSELTILDDGYSVRYTGYVDKYGPNEDTTKADSLNFYSKDLCDITFTKIAETEVDEEKYMIEAESYAGTVGGKDVTLVSVTDSVGTYATGLFVFDDGIKVYKSGESQDLPEDYVFAVSVKNTFSLTYGNQVIPAMPIGTTLDFGNVNFVVNGTDGTASIMNGTYTPVGTAVTISKADQKAVDIDTDNGEVELNKGAVDNMGADQTLVIKTTEGTTIDLPASAAKLIVGNKETVEMDISTESVKDSPKAKFIIGNHTGDDKAKLEAATYIDISFPDAAQTSGLGEIKVTTPFSLNGRNADNLAVYYVNEETGELEQLNGRYYETSGQGYYEFYTTHFSGYVISEKLSEDKDGGISIALVAGIVVAILAVAGVGAFLFVKNRKPAQ